MVFTSPAWVPAVDSAIPRTISIGDFVVEGKLGPNQNISSPILACASSGKKYTVDEIKQRVDYVSRALSKELGWQPNAGEPLDKVLGIYSFNTIEYLIVSWAVHRLNGIVLTLHPTNSDAENEKHLEATQCRVVFTCASLLANCMRVTDELGIFRDRVYLFDIAGEEASIDAAELEDYRTFEHLLTEGADLAPLETALWAAEQNAQIAFLAATSGTSGIQKLAKISHYNIIANMLQACAYEKGTHKDELEVAFMPLPLSHTYALEVSHMTLWRRDTIVLQTRFDMMKMLGAIPQFRINRLYLVPPIIFALAKNPFLLKMGDVSSVKTIVSGSAPLGKVLSGMIWQLKPEWNILTGYGLTESSIIATLSSINDMMAGSSGSLLPDVQLRLLGFDGKDVDNLETPGEVLLKGPNIISGYFNDEEASRSLIDVDGWLHSGDVGLMRHSPKGNEHLFIVDRIRDMIKVKGMQVAPVEIEVHLSAHPGVADVAVVGVSDDLAGERAKAFIVCSPAAMAEATEEEVKASINAHVESSLNELCWLGDRIVLVNEIPRNQSGKILKRVLREMAQSP